MGARLSLRLDGEPLGRLVAALAAAGYTRAGLEQLLGADAFDAGFGDIPILERRAGSGTLAALAKLFFLDLAVPEDELGLDLDALAEAGIVSRSAGRVESKVRLVPYGDLILASDRREGSTDDPDDLVQAITRSATDCLDLTVREPVGRALDVGTGSGIQALVARSHAAEVVATDVNEHALDLAWLSARLNGIEGIDFRAGSLFEPVAGEEFGLIVCNAPFVVSPEAAYAYRDGPTSDDGISERLVRDAPAHLADGGFATIMVSWIEQDGVESGARAAAWAADSGCDVWVLAGHLHRPLEYAALWNRRLVLDPECLRRRARRMGAELRGARRNGNHRGRRPPAPPRGEELDAHRPDGPGGAAVGGRAAAPRLPRPRLSRGPDDQAVLQGRFSPAERHRFTQSFAAGPDGVALQDSKLSLDEGLMLEANVDPSFVALFTKLAAGTPLGEAAAELNVPADRAVAIVREMLATGFLEPQE